MVLEKLGNALKNVMNKIANTIFLDKKAIDALCAELKQTLIEADVDLKIIGEIIEKLKKIALNENIKGIEKKEQLVKLLNDEIIIILGKKKYELEIEKKQSIRMMLLGLYGSGKTTTIAKLAFYYSKRGYKVCMLGLDVHRPAAPEQLEQLAKQIKVDVFINKQEKNPEKIWKEFERKFGDYDLILIDTAGRDALNKELINEIKRLDKLINPHYSLLVMPADIGQGARKQAAEFKNSCGISGVILTRMDGTAKAGGALSACYETGSPVLFIGTGEHIHDLEVFNPTNFVSRMLGLGDIEALLEKVKTASESEGKKDKREIDGFTLIDFYEQIKTAQSMGPLGKITELIPGMGVIKIPQNLIENQQEKMKRWKYAIDSMTLDEIENPELLEKQTSRISRIANGSGSSAGDVHELINQYKLIKGMASSGKNLDLGKIQSARDLGSLGINQKQLKKLAKKFKF
ncbi:signal recognition particle receptor subunit alpha [Candidatus Pacearchaeota archaeon]|nr:signal recognition particle receptor subunit alpha [Candidatus Pacearchaeota archaeon]